MAGKSFLGVSCTCFLTAFLAGTGGGILGGLSWGMDWPFDPVEAEKRQKDAAQSLGIERKMTFDFGSGGNLEMALIPGSRFFYGIPSPDGFKAVCQVIAPDLPGNFFYGRWILVVSGFFSFAYALFFFGKKILTSRWHYSFRDYFIFIILGLAVAFGYFKGKHAFRDYDKIKNKYFELSAFPHGNNYWDGLNPNGSGWVKMENPFFISVREVSNSLFAAILGKSQTGGSPESPVLDVPEDEILLFFQALNQKIPKSFRIPTVWEWEYAALAGSPEMFPPIFLEKDSRPYFQGQGFDWDLLWRERAKPVNRAQNPFGIEFTNPKGWELVILPGSGLEFHPNGSHNSLHCFGFKNRGAFNPTLHPWKDWSFFAQRNRPGRLLKGFGFRVFCEAVPQKNEP